MLKGYVDSFGLHPASAGWFFAGWIAVAPALARGLPVERATAEIASRDGTTETPVKLVLYERGDLKGDGVGVLLFAVGGSALADDLRHIVLRFGASNFRMGVIGATTRLHASALVTTHSALISGDAWGHREALAALLAAEGFNGVSTVEKLPEFVRIGIDEMVVCGREGVVLMGWLLAWPGAITSITLCGLTWAMEIDLARLVRTDRLDVLDSVGRDWGFEDSQCGFIVYGVGVAESNEPAWLRIQTRDGRVGYAPIPQRRLRGMRAIRRVLETIDLPDNAVRTAYDKVVGPACRQLNAERLSVRPAVCSVQFGTAPAAPRHSLVVPIYGRVDYLEHQLAALSFIEGAEAWDILYVLDDPPRRGEALALAESAFARFGLPFRVLIPEQNMGFAPASNVGLTAARGEFVCFLNSDVVPATADFLHRLTSRLERDKRIGIVGAVLLFEDGSVQHEGMVMRPVGRHGGLRFPDHVRKGWRPRDGLGLQRCEMITGACMVMRREQAAALGGFDEAFIIGDFEDADLCQRARDAGLTVAIDHDVRLYHLERQSQASPSHRWRHNLTLYNAWVFDQRYPAAA